MEKNLYEDIQKAYDKWNERSMLKVGGVSLTQSDIYTLEMYADCIRQCGTYEGQLMKPQGNVAKVLVKYGYM